MQIDGPIERLGRLEDRPVFFFVEVLVVGVRVDNKAVEFRPSPSAPSRQPPLHRLAARPQPTPHSVPDAADSFR
jgi:hypothetical protein